MLTILLEIVPAMAGCGATVLYFCLGLWVVLNVVVGQSLGFGSFVPATTFVGMIFFVQNHKLRRLQKSYSEGDASTRKWSLLGSPIMVVVRATLGQRIKVRAQSAEILIGDYMAMHAVRGGLFVPERRRT